MYSAHIVKTVPVQATSISLTKLIKRDTWYGEEYSTGPVTCFTFISCQLFNGTREMAHWQFSV